MGRPMRKPCNMAVADYNLDGALDLVLADGKGKPEDTRKSGYTLLAETVEIYSEDSPR